MARGDRVLILVDVGAPEPRPFYVTATKKGHAVEVKQVRNLIEVSEIALRGQTVKTDRFMASRVVALVEETAEDARGIAAAEHFAAGGL